MLNLGEPSVGSRLSGSVQRDRLSSSVTLLVPVLSEALSVSLGFASPSDVPCWSGRSFRRTGFYVRGYFDWNSSEAIVLRRFLLHWLSSLLPVSTAGSSVDLSTLYMGLNRLISQLAISIK